MDPALLDLDRVPLDRPGSPGWQALLAQSRAALARAGMFDLVGLLRPGVAAGLAETLAPRAASEGFVHRRDHTIYFSDDLPGLAPDHPARQRVTTANRTLCADQVGDTLLPALHAWSPLARFLAAALGLPALYPMDDPLGCINVMRYDTGEGLNWHFDRADFTTTLLLQAPEAGGVFEYRPALRSDTAPNYDGVGRLLRGQDRQVRRTDPAPGTLTVFRGRNTAHRVTPVGGPTARLIAVLSFHDRPGVRLSAEERLGFYGRA